MRRKEYIYSMKIRLIIYFVFISSALSAQTKTIEQTNTDLNLKEVFTVLKSNEQIKEGEYRAYGVRNNTLLYQGYYKNNLKDSVWTYNGHKGESAEGRFKEGKRVGLWEMYDYDGALKAQYDFDTNTLVYLKQSQTDSTKHYGIFKGNKIVETKLDRPPLYLNGNGFMAKIGITNMRYPQTARERPIQGAVIIGVTISERGEIEGYRIKQHLAGGCDDEAMRVIKLMDGDWLPGILNGKEIKTEVYIPFNFALAN